VIRLRQRSWETFQRHAVEDFERRMVVHLRKFYPLECAALGEEQLSRLIRYGTERASGHGFTSERAVCIYIDVMVAFGRDFDCDASVPWASQVLSRKDIGGSKERVTLLFARAYEHRDQARGLGAEGGLH
jgi:hypothetical protein